MNKNDVINMAAQSIVEAYDARVKEEAAKAPAAQPAPEKPK